MLLWGAEGKDGAALGPGGPRGNRRGPAASLYYTS